MEELNNSDCRSSDIVSKVCAETVTETENEISPENLNLDETTISLQNIEISTRNVDDGMVFEDIVDQAHEPYQKTLPLPDQTPSVPQQTASGHLQTPSTASLLNIEISTPNPNDRMIVEDTVNPGVEQALSPVILQNIEISTQNSDDGMVDEDNVAHQPIQKTYQPEQTATELEQTQSTVSLQIVEIYTQTCDHDMVVEDTVDQADKPDQEIYKPEQNPSVPQQTLSPVILQNIEISTQNSDDGMVVEGTVDQANERNQETYQPEQAASGSEQISSGLETTPSVLEQTPPGLEETTFEPEQTPSKPEQTITPYFFENALEVAKFNGPSENKKHFSGCKWSPDGTCLLTTSADYTLRLFDLPKDFYSKSSWNESEGTLELVPSLKMIEGGIVYDYAWYPHMSSWNPLTCCFISTSSGSPIHLWDAYTGKIRASYRAYNYADEVHAALSVAFSTNGERIYSGFRDAVKVFDIAKPGRNCEILNLKTISGQKGLVSCIIENPVMPELFAIGTYSKTIGLYTNSKEFVCLLTGQKSGLTQIKFSNDGYKLFSGARVDDEIICWDIRNPGTVFATFDRIVTTNQRIYFDLSLDNRYLISGGTDGVCRMWDLHEETKLNSEGKVDPAYKFKAHNDCVNGVSLHKSYPIIATVSGQYHYPDLTEDDDEKIFSDELTMENNLKLWWAGAINGNEENMNVDV